MRRTLLLAPLAAFALLAASATAGDEREPREPSREEAIRRLHERLDEFRRALDRFQGGGTHRRLEAWTSDARPREGRRPPGRGPEGPGARGEPRGDVEARLARLEEENRRLRGEVGELRQQLRRVVGAMGDKGRARLETEDPRPRPPDGPPRGRFFESEDGGRTWGPAAPRRPGSGMGEGRGPGGGDGRGDMRRTLERARERLRELEERLRERTRSRGLKWD